MTTIFNYPRLSIFVPDENKVLAIKNLYRQRTPIIYVGSMTETKGGLFHMIRAMGIIRDQRPDILLLLVGPVERGVRQRMLDAIEAGNLHDCVDVIGFIPHQDVVNYISIAKVGLIANQPTPKFRKNIPIKQFEYMACGVPVLGADLPPIASFVRAAGCGMVFDSTNPQALAEGVLTMLQDEREWQRMSEAGKKAVRDMWNWDRMEHRLFDIYEKLGIS
ncbi:MAG: glycosyltransferase [Thermodesulfobacteriota bacterium]